MQDLPPPEPPVARTDHSLEVAGIISVGGSAEKIAEFSDLLKQYPMIEVESEASGAGDNRLLILRSPASARYRDIGGLIYAAQSLGLAIAITSSTSLRDDQVK